LELLKKLPELETKEKYYERKKIAKKNDWRIRTEEELNFFHTLLNNSRK